MANLRDFITIRQAADLIGVSPATLRNWDRSGKLRAARNPMNRYRLYRKEDIATFLAGVVRPEAQDMRRRESHGGGPSDRPQERGQP